MYRNILEQGTRSTNQSTGLDYLREARLNKELAFPLEERQALGIHGLLPPRFMTQEEQLELCRLNVDSYREDLKKYIFLMDLLDRNEKLFYRLLSENVDSLMPIVYTPTVGLACQKYGMIYRRPRGLFITIHDKGHVYEVLKNWPVDDVRAIVVTDGERILGLGDLGANGMGIPVGKLALYTALAGIKPHQCLPITLDVGTNNKKLMNDLEYIGLREKRITGQQYHDLVEEFMEAAVQRFGQDVLIHFEDIGTHNSFDILEKYRDKYCTFNDDIQGTAAVGVAGLLSALRVTNSRLSDNILLFYGAGQANLGIARHCVAVMVAEGMPEEEATGTIWMMDSKGLIVRGRPRGGLNPEKERFAHPHRPVDTLVEAVRIIKPSILIGASTVSGAFTPEILKMMAANNDRPIIFALSNPTSKAECTAEQAYVHTKGAVLFASGSPFPPVIYNGKTFSPGQANNAHIFPGVALGIITFRIRHVREEIFQTASQALAEMVTDTDLECGRLYPPFSDSQAISTRLAVRIGEQAYRQGMVSTYPEPEDKEAFVKKHLYNNKYEPSLPTVYPWPQI